jgi:outer membrane protein TolC
LLEAQIRTNTEVLELAELSFQRGEGTGVQVLQQRQQLEATKAQIPLVRAAATIATQQLAILLGRAPSELTASLPETLPALPPAPPLGTPDALLGNRPDLRAADERLTAAWQRRMSSERAFLPTLSIGTSVNVAYSNTQDINIGLNTTVEYGSYYGWGLNAAVRLPIFDGGLTIANLRSARATEAAASHALGSASLVAMAEVQGALAQEQGQLERQAAVQRQAEAAEAAFKAAVDRYREGAGDYLTVLTTLVAHQNADLAALQVGRDVLSARISLYDALGGAWTRELARTTSSDGPR